MTSTMSDLMRATAAGEPAPVPAPFAVRQPAWNSALLQRWPVQPIGQWRGRSGFAASHAVARWVASAAPAGVELGLAKAFDRVHHIVAVGALPQVRAWAYMGDRGVTATEAAQHSPDSLATDNALEDALALTRRFDAATGLEENVPKRPRWSFTLAGGHVEHLFCPAVSRAMAAPACAGPTVRVGCCPRQARGFVRGSGLEAAALCRLPPAHAAKVLAFLCSAAAASSRRSHAGHHRLTARLVAC